MMRPILVAFVVLSLSLTFQASAPAQESKQTKPQEKPKKETPKEDPDAKPLVIKGEVTFGVRDYKMKAGRIYTIRVKSKSFRPILAVYDGTRQVAYINAPGGTGNYYATLAMTPTRDTTYKIIVAQNYSSTIPKGGMKYSVDITSVVPTIVLNKSETFKTNDPVHPRSRGYYKTYALKLKRGHPYQMTQASQTLSCYLFLENSKGQIISYGRTVNGRNSQINYTPSADGTYRLIASERFRRRTGSFTVQVLDLTKTKK